MDREKEKEKYLAEKAKSFRAFLKKNPIRRKPKPVRQRTKKSRITVESDFGPLNKDLKDVKLKVTAAPDAWRKLGAFLLHDPHWFGFEFQSSFYNKAVYRLNNKNKPRGKQKKIHDFVNSIKIRAALLYVFLQYWSKKETSEWPEYLKRVVEIVNEEAKDQIRLKRKGYNPAILTAYMIDKLYGREAQTIGLKPFLDFENRDGTDNFYFTYIQGSNLLGLFKRDFIENRNDQEIEDLVYSREPLKSYFDHFGVL